MTFGRSGLISDAFDARRQCRAEFDDVLYAAYDAAEEACRGALLNAEGRARNIDALSLFMGNTARAHRYASEELREWWETHPRVTFAMFERQWADQRAWEMAG
ncbi:MULTISPECIES: hypothetical protein [Microbacterium]|uniref:hypothetical protein n=1 Tax=Microbacterium sp. 4NA327F11 TaxID=2502229 RepID=UPI0010F97058|nr:hypothetical protein [Microbacterium sp. 4NA327F11]MCK9917227.1 hypothetical protein [Microbacteriaceae bacterium K1510]